MQKYENYTPEINYSDDLPSVVSSSTTDKTKRPSTISKKRRVSRKKEEATKPDTPQAAPKVSWWEKTVDALTCPSARILLGIFLGCLTVYLGVSFCSYFSTCIQDQSKIASAAVGYAKGVSNPGGEGGARLAELLINEGFGLGSLVIVIWLGALTLKLLVGKPRFKTVDFTIKCIVALLTVSLIIGLVTYSMHTPVNWGGYHGTYVNEFIINFIGGIGAVLLSFFMVALFVVICLRDMVNWIIRKRKVIAEKRRIAAEEKAARLAREEEIRRMQEQERMDDIKAGEADIPENLETFDEVDEHLEFRQDDVTLYNLIENTSGDESTTSVTTDQGNDAESAEISEDSASGVSEGLDKTSNENSGTADKPVDETVPEDTASDDEADAKEKMVVNVNQIQQAEKKHFRSEVELLESHKYKFPPLEFLREGSERISVDAEEQMQNKEKIERTLLDFGIPITKIEATVGPTVTLYEIVPDKGVTIAKIRKLVDDIALSLRANGVRIIAPIPGKGTVGIEVANQDPQTVSMRTVIQSSTYQETKCALPIAIGSTISNKVFITDLAKMPHLLVAGATGQGKSVGLNAIITSLLYAKAPHELKFVMIDPKSVEFPFYNKLRDHYMASLPYEDLDEPVITDLSRVEDTLNSLCTEMDNRYMLLKDGKVRTIEAYNELIRSGSLNPADGHRFLPYIVLIVDEFADLIMVLKKNVEMPIARLAQKGRAAGLHVIIATQRPSTDVITGLIKSNFPARMSFRVSSGIDSKTILDTTGAQQLIGKGDMLISQNSEMVRVQCAFIDTPEVEKICEYVERQPYPQGIYELPEPAAQAGAEGGAEATGPVGELDPLLPEVARACVKSGSASTSSVQRHYGIGYNRAGRIMDQLEKLGVVGPATGGKPRAVLVDPMDLENILNAL